MPRLVKVPHRFTIVRSGEWQQPIPKGYLFKCCDCGLIHSMDFRIHKGKVQFRGFRVTRKKA